MILFISCLLVFFDGIEVVILGVVSTPIIEEWSLSPIQYGALTSYTAFGMILGGLVCGPLADKAGRVKIILFSTFLYSFFTLMGAFSQGIVDFGIYRFLAGVGMGGIIPTILGLITDLSPKKNRALIVSTVTTCMGLGGVFAAMLAIFVLPSFGWRAMFVVGAFPLLCIPFIYKYMPDSPLSYLRKGKNDQLAKLLNRLSYSETFTSDQKFEMKIVTHAKVPFTALLQSNMALGTAFIWLTFFFSYLVSFGLTAWLPNLMVQSGYPLGSSLMFMTVNLLGATISTLVGGKIADKIGMNKIIVVFFMLGGISLMVLGIKFSSVFLLYIFVFMAGWGTVGTQNLLLAFCSQFYPTEIRATGNATAAIMGRVGSFVGPLFGGALVASNVPTAMCFMAFGAVAFTAAISFFFVSIKKNKTVATSVGQVN